jgi:hypothetical protein
MLIVLVVDFLVGTMLAARQGSLECMQFTLNDRFRHIPMYGLYRALVCTMNHIEAHEHEQKVLCKCSKSGGKVRHQNSNVTSTQNFRLLFLNWFFFFESLALILRR